jgi:8-oxo-dGTP pyrophosphatase MutT (NUDIX family)
MSPDDGGVRGPIPLGPVGGYVIANLTELREARKLTYRELSERLKAIGRVIPPLGLSRIEKGSRRVDADDLVALALALRVNPAALLLPRTGGTEDVVELAPHVRRSMLRAWRWMDGAGPLPQSGDDRVAWQEIADFAAHARPQHAPLPEAVAEIVKRYSPTEDSESQPVVAAIVTSAEGVLITRRQDGKPSWGFVAGETEPGEIPEDAAVREVKEETGLEVRAGRILGERDHPRTGKRMVYMAAKPVRGTKVIVGDEAELAEVKWATLAEAHERMPDMYQPVADYLAAEL